MYGDMLNKILLLFQGASDDSPLLEGLKKLNDCLIDLDAYYICVDEEKRVPPLASARKAVVSVREQLALGPSTVVDVEALTAVLDGLGEGESPDRRTVREYRKLVSTNYLALQQAIALRRQAKKKRTRILGYLGVIPFVASLLYGGWLFVSHGFEVVSNEVEWPQGAYAKELALNDTYNFNEDTGARLKKLLSSCYFPNDCTESNLLHTPFFFTPDADFFQHHQLGIKYPKLDQPHSGIVFRTQFRYRNSESVPVNRVALAIEPVELYSKGSWFAGGYVPEVKANVDTHLYENRFVITTNRPLVNLTATFSYTDTDFKTGKESLVVLTKSAYEVIDSIEFMNQHTQDYVRFDTDDSGKLLPGPYYVSTSGRILPRLPKVHWDPYRQKEMDVRAVPEEDRDRLLTCYKATTLSELSDVGDVRRISNVKASLSYQWLDKSMHEYAKANEETWYIAEAKDFFPCNVDYEAMAAMSGMPMSSIAALAGANPLASGAKGKDEIELWFSLNFGDETAKTQYLNDVLASGGYVDIYSHIDDLPSGRYTVTTSINGHDVYDFEIEYLNPLKERFARGDIYSLWKAAVRPDVLEERQAEELLQKLIARTTNAGQIAALRRMEAVEDLSLNFDDVSVSHVLMILNDFVDTGKPDRLRIEAPESSETLKIRVKDMAWLKAVLLVAHKQGWNVDVDGSAIRLVQE